jgi:hypothetical protein
MKAHTAVALTLMLGLVVSGCGVEPAATTTTTATNPTTIATTTSTATSTTSAASTTSTRPTTTTTEPPGAEVVNLGIAAVWIQPLDDGGVALGVEEASLGRDLNGDGDTADTIVHTVLGEEAISTGLPAEWGVLPIPGGGCAIPVVEAAMGWDLNGDGDLGEEVPHLWLPKEGIVEPGVAGWSSETAGSSVWIHVYEPWEGRDLNGDGDVAEDVAHLWNPATGLLNSGWAAGSIRSLADGSALFGVFEEQQGGTDLDEDGTADDHVALWWRGPGQVEVIATQVYAFEPTLDGGALIRIQNAGAEQQWSLRMWHPDRPSVDLDMGTVCHLPTLDGGAFFKVAETFDYWGGGTACDQGIDRNGDGDCSDFILQHWSPGRGLVDLGLADPGWCPECDCGLRLDDSGAAWVSVYEAGSGADLNDDGDVDDLVLHRVTGTQVENLGVAVAYNAGHWAMLAEGVVLAVAEDGTDLDGDGDGSDSVFHYISGSGETTNLATTGEVAVTLRDGSVLLMAEEERQSADLNGDGVIASETLVVQWWRSGIGVVNTGVTAAQSVDAMSGGLAVRRVGELAGGNLVLLVPEDRHGNVDLNGDGDTVDQVVHIVRLDR